MEKEIKNNRTNWPLRTLRLRYRLGKSWDRLVGRESGLDMSTMTDFYKRTWSEAARELGAGFTEVAEGLWKVSTPERTTLINNYVVQIDDPVVLNIAGNKSICYRILKGAGLTVPENLTYTVDTIEAAEDFVLARKGSCFVVKPSAGTSGGRGITTHLKTFKECLRASVLASLYSRELIIERLVPGESFRLLVLDGQMILASRRTGLWITGNGTSTAKELAGKAAKSGAAPDAPVTEEDRDLEATLAAQGLAAGSVLRAGESVLAKSVKGRTGRYVEVRTAYDEDATGLICPELKKEAESAAAAMGTRFAGIDIVTIDPSVPLKRSGGAIVEVNTTPGLHHHYNLNNTPAGTHGSSPAVRVLGYLLGKR